MHHTHTHTNTQSNPNNTTHLNNYKLQDHSLSLLVMTLLCSIYGHCIVMAMAKEIIGWKERSEEKSKSPKWNAIRFNWFFFSVLENVCIWSHGVRILLALLKMWISRWFSLRFFFFNLFIHWNLVIVT